MTLAFAQFGWIFAALGAGRHGDAYLAAERLFDPASPAHHPVVACWIIGDLADAALRTDQTDEAHARVKQVAAASGDTPGTCIAVGLRHARAVLAQDPEEQARDAFDAMGCAAWGDQARRELRASGESSSRRDRAARDQLTAQAAAHWAGCYGSTARRSWP